MSYTPKDNVDAKRSVRAATTAALATNSRSGNVLTASANGALASIDGVSLAVGNRLLVKNEATGANNGIYIVTSLGSAGTPFVLTRAFDADGSLELNAGATVPVEEGTVNADSIWILTTNETVTINTTSLLFSRVGGYGSSPVGQVTDFAGSSAPSGWLLCFGQLVSRTTYSELFAVISTTFGVGDGSTTFGIPDLRGRVGVGLDNMGGSDAGRLSAANTLGLAGGSETHALSTAELAVHSHANTATQAAHAHQPGSTTRSFVTATTSGITNKAFNTTTPAGVTRFVAGSSGGPTVQSLALGAEGTVQTDSGGDQQNNASTDNATPAITMSNANAGSGTAHNNLQPYMLLNKIIYAGV